ncbi:hypothetical protein BKA58DRAFT_400784 [Alternaria rosae]|uniref:uncharacterized protein n=1 Tax=Alternaria rosae TaxID=1187941 RepID=UPI001E8CBF47|nr:uncharacterized protein BKA58DRAFT_400784 [Alternaria rosae]KAH6872564.1 hypothetical protein BKA58DRAFT_400784 [Alternaria rosae]
MADHPGVPVRFKDDGYRSVRSHVQEKADRDLHRVDRIVNRMFFEYSDTTNRLSVKSEVTNESGSSLWISVNDMQGHPGTVSVLENLSLSLKARHTYLSLNQCISVLKAFAPTVSFFTEVLTPSIEIHEAHIDHVQSDQERVRVAAWHSMFRIIATDEHNFCRPENSARLNGTGTYLDPTAAQYGRNQGLRDAGVYHVLSPKSKTQYFTSLGYRYYGCQPKEEDRRARIRVLEMEAYIQTLDNAIHKVVENVGGRAVLFDMSPTEFEAILEYMAAQTRPDLLGIAGDLYLLEHCRPQDIDPSGTASTPDECEGAKRQYWRAPARRNDQIHWYRRAIFRDVFVISKTEYDVADVRHLKASPGIGCGGMAVARVIWQH